MKDASPEMMSIFCAALERLSAQERAAYLETACGRDMELRARLEALLQAHDQAGGFLPEKAEVPETHASVAHPSREGPATVIGPYKLLQQLGEGGMGTVFLAEQTQPVQRKVALKIIKAGMDSRQVIARFEAERQALALMDHPNIAKVHDAGTTETGRPYFVMELVKGVPITRYCDEHRLTLKQRLELFVPVCQAVQHAHQKGIIHRDLKPSNVMVAVYDDKPVPKVIDFGIAKATGRQLTERTLYTEIGQVVGTLEYMSPEQAGLNQLDIDTRSDIYSLGVLLYELLTGTTPLERKRLKAAALLEMLRLIREEEPPKPSTRLSTTDELPSVAANRGQEPKQLSGLVRGELDWLVMKCLEKDRNRRYETANGLAMDIQRYLADEAVQACPPSAWYRFSKFTRRHKVGLRITAAAALVLLLAVGGVSWAMWDQATRRAELSERVAETEKTMSASLIQTEQWRTQAGAAPSATSQEADAVLALWRQAEASLDQAEIALRTGTADDRQRQRVGEVRLQIEQRRAQAQRTAKLLRDLDDARMTQSVWIENHFDFAGAATKYAAAFAAYGLEVTPRRTEELARRIRAEPAAICEALIVALDYWGNAAARAKTSQPANLAWALAAAADDNPWRQKFRAAATARDVKALQNLSAQARRLSLPPSSLELLAASLRFQGAGDEALVLLRWARGRHLTDFWIHFELGFLLQQNKDKSPLILEETIGCYRTALALRPAASAAHNNLGNCLRARKQLDEAIRSYRNALDSEPTNAIAHNNLGRALQEKNLLDDAITEYRKAIDLDPQYADAHFKLGYVLYDKKDLDGAIREYQAALKIDPNLAPAHCNLGNALRGKNQLDQASAEFRKAIDLQPDYAEAHCNLGHVLSQQGRLTESLAAFGRGHELGSKRTDWSYPSAKWARDAGKRLAEEYRKAIDRDPSDDLAHYRLGLALQGGGDLDGAVAVAREHIDRLKKAAAGSARLAAACARLGDLLKSKKDWAGMVSAYREAVHLMPDRADYRTLLVHAIRAGARDEVIAYCSDWIQSGPATALPYRLRGNVYNGRMQYPQALADFIKATELSPQDAEAWSERATVHNNMSQHEESAAEYMKAIEAAQRAGQNPAYYWSCRANQYRGLRQWDKAIADYTKATDLDPKEALYWVQRGNAYRDKGDTEKALADYDMAIKNPTHLTQPGAGLYHRAELNEKLGRWDKAVADWTEHIAVTPRDWKGRELLVRLLVTCPDRAIRDPRRALDIAKQDVLLGPEVVGFYQAMAHAQLGNHDQAQESYDRTVQWMEKNPRNIRVPGLRLGQAEAKELLAAQKKKP